MKFEFIDTGENNGIYNMKYDLQLVDNAGENNIPVFRVYQWKPYAISLGYNQSDDGIDIERCKSEGIDIVRRPTGGRAVYHSEELTYSVVMKVTDMSISETYRFISNKLINALGDYDINIKSVLNFEKNKLDFSKHYAKDISFACFSSSALNEVKANGKKLIGSAQRRFGDILLQHGSIILDNKHKDIILYIKNNSLRLKLQNILDRETTSLNELTGSQVNLQRLKDCLKKEFTECL